MLIVPQFNTKCIINANSIRKIMIVNMGCEDGEYYSIRCYYNSDIDGDDYIDNLYPKLSIAEKVLSLYKRMYLKKENSIFYFPPECIKEEEL